MFIPFGEYLPDQGNYNNPGTPYLTGCLPEANGYTACQSPVTLSTNAIDAYPQGAFSAVDSGGTSYTFVGNASKIYLLSSSAFSDVSVGGGYSTDASDIWDFTAYQQYIIATNYVDAVQYYEMGVSSNFANLTGSPPKARYCARVRDFVVLGGINDGTAYPNRVQWSAFDDPTGSWAVSATTQADYQDLPSNRGWIKRIVGGEYGVVFQEHAITRMTYVGSPVIFQFDEVEAGRGTRAPGSVVKFGNGIFYLGTDGFYVFNGSYSTPIGSEKVNKTFFAEVDTNYYHTIKATLMADKQIIMVSYAGPNNTGGQPNKQLFWNYGQNRWSYAEQQIGMPFLMHSESTDLDDITTSIDSLTYSLDSLAYTSGNIQLAGFGLDKKLATITGEAIQATIQTRDFRPNAGGQCTIFEYRPVITTQDIDISGSVTGSISARDSALHDVVPIGYNSPKDNGVIYTRATGGVFSASIRIDIDEDWQAQGIELLRVADRGRR